MTAPRQQFVISFEATDPDEAPWTPELLAQFLAAQGFANVTVTTTDTEDAR